MTEISERVYALLMRVPRGRVTTYAELARAAGIAGGQRAVGNMMNRNPYMGIVPCHRVVRSDGGVGGFAYGPAAKGEMLAAEGVGVSGGRIDDMESAMFRF